ncbi:MAG TPA: hypothetical protein VGM82_00020 [Gemmatimonadaceae bacterium]|jgi:hypothetical protein
MQSELRGTPVWVDWELRSLLEATELVRSPAERRMNAIENLATKMTAPWRTGRFRLESHIRFARSTQPELLEWILLCGRGDTQTARLEWYQSSTLLIDDSVPTGMLRVLL